MDSIPGSPPSAPLLISDTVPRVGPAVDRALGQVLGHLNLNLAGVCLTEVTSLLWASVSPLD